MFEMQIRDKFVLVALVLLCWLGQVALAQVPEDMPDTRPAFEAMRKGKYLQALALLEQHDPNHDMVKQELGTSRSFVGDCQGALAAFATGVETDAVKIDELKVQLDAATPLPALDTIVQLAKDRQIVILNEAHHVPRHRAFAMQLAIRLKELGFEYFAAETFSPLTEVLQKQGYPDLMTGFYSNEPVFGDLIRTTLRLGYQPIAYEMLSFPPANADQTDRVNHRESEQCNNLMKKIFQKNPNAKVLIFVGYSHATEDTRTLADGRESAWMAARLKKATGIDPLTIDQTLHTDFSGDAQRSNPWEARISTSGIEGPVVFRQADQQFLVQGSYAGKMDVQVIHPPTKLQRGRPNWLLALDGRRAVEIPTEILESKKRILVQAFVASEPDNAIPVDQVLVVPGAEPPVLALPEGSYRIVVQDEEGGSQPHGPLTVEQDAGEEPVLRFGFEENQGDFELTNQAKRDAYRVSLVRTTPFAGESCLGIATPPTGVVGFNRVGQAATRLDATTLRGKRIRWSAYVRTQCEPFAIHQVRLWVAAVRPNQAAGAWSDMGGYGIRSDTWQKIEVLLDVDNDATELEIGFQVCGHKIEAFFDDATLEVIETVADSRPSSQQLSPRSVQNLIAFAKLSGFVQHFYPGDEAQQVDWDQWTVAVVDQIIAAENDEELRGSFEHAFAPMGSALQIWPADQPAPALPVLSSSAGDSTHLVTMRHVGVGANGSLGFFRSERVFEGPIQQGLVASTEKLSSPKCTEISLGNGLMARIPTVMEYGRGRTFPQAEIRQAWMKLPSESAPLTAHDCRVRIAAVLSGWSRMHYFFPYFDVVHCNWELGLEEALNKAALDKDPIEFHETLEELWSLLQDSHTVVRGGSGTPIITGALPLSWDYLDEHLVVTWVAETSSDAPKPGDLILAIDGQPVREMFEARLRRACAATPQARRMRVCQDLRNGTAGQLRRLTIQNEQGKIRNVEMKLDEADGHALRGPALREPRHPVVYEIDPNLVYIDLDRFKFVELQSLPKPLEQYKAIILDLRGYPSQESIGFFATLGSGDHLCDRFLTPITLGTNPFGPELQESPGSDKWPRAATKLPQESFVFITDGRAGSAAETILGIVRNSNLGKIVGEATAGSNGGVNLHYLPGGFRVSWTNQVTRKRDGSVFHGVGIVPDREVKQSIAALRQGRDLLLENAIEVASKETKQN